ADLRHVVADGDGGWFARRNERGHQQVQDFDGTPLHGGGDAHVSPARTGERFAPTLYLYDNYPGGVGLSEPLFDRQQELIGNARSLIDACDCVAGCPACVGPVLAADEAGDDDTPKSLALRVLHELSRSSHQAEAQGKSAKVWPESTMDASSAFSQDGSGKQHAVRHDPW